MIDLKCPNTIRENQNRNLSLLPKSSDYYLRNYQQHLYSELFCNKGDFIARMPLTDSNPSSMQDVCLIYLVSNQPCLSLASQKSFWLVFDNFVTSF